MSDHAKYSPSSAHRWLHCTASVHMEAEIEEQETSQHAEEGIEAHKLLEKAIKGQVRPSKLAPDHPAARDVDLAYDQVCHLFDEPGWEVFPECTVHLNERCWGTADITIIGPNVLQVIDYKHGKGVLVEVPSEQLEIYALAALKEFYWALGDSVDKVETVIVQPRAVHPDGPIRSHIYDIKDLMPQEEVITSTIENIESGVVSYSPGEKTCKWCRALPTCAAAGNEALERARAYFTPAGRIHTPDPQTAGALSDDERVAIFEARDFLRTWLTAVETGIQKDLLSGKQVPGLKVVAGTSRRKWGRDEEEIIDTLRGELKLKPSEFMPPKLLGPAPIEKLIDVKKRGGKKKMETLQALIVKPEGKPTVVSETDPRPSIAPHFKPLN